MCLLKYDHDDGFSLVEFRGDCIPDYAILSHNWGAGGDEVTFKDLAELTGKNKSGYSKLTFRDGQVRKDRLQGYFWLDTCCTIQTHHRRQCPTEGSAFATEDDGRTYISL